MGDELFNYQENKEIRRTPDRPLGVVSTYVAERMPEDLAKVRGGGLTGEELAKKTGVILDALNPQVITEVLTDAKKRDVAKLDLALIESGIVHSGATPPEKLVELVDRFAQASGQLPITTYEDLVLINPLNTDPRTFTEGRVGKSELDFYVGHKQIEDLMEVVNAQIRWVILDLAQRKEAGVVDAQRVLAEVHDLFVKTLKPMDQMGDDMDNADFPVFRVYFQPHPIRRLKGASGAFSAAIPTFDLLLGGENISQQHLDYLRENRVYFPRQGRDDIQEGLEFSGKGMTLNALQKELGIPGLTDPLKQIDRSFKLFRGKHLKAVVKQTPEVFRGEQAGTAGETDAAKFLKGRKDTTHIDQ